MNISVTTALALISRCMNKMHGGQLEPHAGAARISRILSKAYAQLPGTFAPLLRIWQRLTDLARFDEQGTRQMVLRAASEWLALPPEDADARAAYLERWIHDELGFRRKPPRDPASAGQRRGQAKVTSPLTARLPKHSGDVDAARELVALGYPEVAPVLPQLFQWLETNGSPVERVIRPFLAELGAPARDLACKALLHPGKPAVKHSLLRYVLTGWPREVVATLPLEGYLYNSGDGYGLDVWALKLMIDMRIPTHDGLEGLTQARDFKIARLEAHLAVLASLALPAHSA